MKQFWVRTKQLLSNLVRGVSQIRQLGRKQFFQVLDAYNNRERLLILTVLLVMLISGGFLLHEALTNHGPGPHNGGGLTEGLVGQPQFINPVLAPSNEVDTDLSRIVYAQLLKYDDNEQLAPDLAQALPTVSADQKTYTLKLKPNLKWQDGKPLNSDDVLFTIETIQNADFESPLRPNWARVKVDKVDDLTLTFTLREVQASFMDNFALGIIPKHIWDGLSARNFRLSNDNLNPIGSGPFVISSVKKMSNGNVVSIVMTPNENYYAGRPFLDNVTFKFYDTIDSLISAYQGREITSLGFTALTDKAFIAASNKYNQYQLSLPQYQAVFFNFQKNTILQDKAVRQALWLTTNRTDIINNVYSGQAAPAYGPILPGTLGYDPNIATQAHESVDEANGILDKGGWVLDPNTKLRTKKNQALEFSLAVNGSSPLDVKTAQLLQNQWQRVGVKVDLTIVSASDLEQNYIRPRAFDALLFSENIGADPDPFPFWAGSQVHDPGLNLSGFSSSLADQLLTQARQTTDANIRSKDYVQFQAIINDQLPAIFLVRSLYIYNVPKKIQGINLTNIIEPSERFKDINQWYQAN